MPRKILHIDLDAFFCAVEEIHDPSLKGKPFAVGGRPESRSVVSSCSYAARQFGVRSAMPVRRAVQLCPGLLIITPDHHEYSDYSDKVMQRLGEWTALIEQISIDEAFLDLSDLPDPPQLLAQKLQKDILVNVGLPCSLGAATNKLVAKIATDFGKSGHRGVEPPCAITVVTPGEEANFLAKLPVQALWGVGPKTTERFSELGIRSIGDLAAKSENELVQMLGKMGHELYLRSRGIDDRPIVTEYEAKSISQEVTFDRDIIDIKKLTDVLREICTKVGWRLRRAKLCGKTVRLKLRWADFTTISRQVTLPNPTDQDDIILNSVLELFHQAWKTKKPVRLVGVGVSHFENGVLQLGLWDQSVEKKRKLYQAVDELQIKFGKDKIHRGEKRG
jgi:DNA polymerase-4